MPDSCGVRSGSSTVKSRPLSKCAASAMVRAGMSCSVMAMSPNAEVEVNDTDPLAALVGQGDAEVDRERGLADPALRREHRDELPDRTGRRGGGRTVERGHTCLARRTAAPRPVRSRSSTTSRMPERRASASTLVSTRRRIRMTLDRGTSDPEHVREGGSRLEVHARAENDGVLVG